MTFDPTLDRREAILERLTVLVGDVTGFTAWRNRRGLEDSELPAVVVLDGDEEVISDVVRLKSVRMPPVIVKMTPQVIVGIRIRDTVDNLTLDGVANPAGTELNSWRVKLYDTVTNDDQLIDLVTANGQIFYRRCLTDLKTGRSIGAYGAQLQMEYEFYYPLFPAR